MADSPKDAPDTSAHPSAPNRSGDLPSPIKTYRHPSRRVFTVLALTLGVGLTVEAVSLPWTLGRFPTFLSALESIVTFPVLNLGSFQLTLALLYRTLLLLAIIWLATQISARIVRRTILNRTQLDEGRKYSVQRMVAYVVFALGLLFGLQVLGLDISTFAVFGGALGIGLGLGFQSMAKNFASGLLLLIEQPIKVGDRIVVGDVQGDIVQIGSRGTWVRTNDNIVMIIPNSEFVDGMVTNFTVNDRTVRITLPLGVSYASNPLHVERVLIATAGRHEDVLEEPRPSVIFTGFGDSSLDFELRVYTKSRVTAPRVIRSEVYFDVFAAFKREGIEIPFPQRDLHVRSVSPAVGWRILSNRGGEGAADSRSSSPAAANDGSADRSRDGLAQ